MTLFRLNEMSLDDLKSLVIVSYNFYIIFQKKNLKKFSHKIMLK